METRIESLRGCILGLLLKLLLSIRILSILMPFKVPGGFFYQARLLLCYRVIQALNVPDIKPPRLSLSMIIEALAGSKAWLFLWLYLSTLCNVQRERLRLLLHLLYSLS